MIWIIFIFTSFMLIGDLRGAKYYCDPNFTVRDWVFDKVSPPPADFNSSLELYPDNKEVIHVFLTNRKEDFEFTAFFKQVSSNESECPGSLEKIKTKELRKYYTTCPVSKNGNESVPRYFGAVPTACYYFVMTNKTGNNWVHGPVFYKTNYHHVDTQLEVIENSKVFAPQNIESSKKLHLSLKVPLHCMEVRASLYQLHTNHGYDRSDIKSGRVPSAQTCTFTKIDKKVNCHFLLTDLELRVEPKDMDNGDGYEARITWNKLKPEGGWYSIFFMGYTTENCKPPYDYSRMNTWLPIEIGILLELDYEQGGNNGRDQGEPELPNFVWHDIAYGLLGTIVLVILFYWVWKYRRLLRDKFFIAERSGELQRPVPQIEVKESKNILLLYEKSIPEFKKEMANFKHVLERRCDDFCIRDVYAMSEYESIRDYGVSSWVQMLLKEGSKVVWVDTPQFRSRLNDRQKYTANGSCDDAVPYAVDIATDLFLNVTTQYRRHFVVRMKGYEVGDGDDDPLQVVSPHARYYIPEHLDLLCEHLRGPMKLLETTIRVEREVSLQNSAIEV